MSAPKELYDLVKALQNENKYLRSEVSRLAAAIERGGGGGFGGGAPPSRRHPVAGGGGFAAPARSAFAAPPRAEDIGREPEATVFLPPRLD